MNITKQLHNRAHASKISRFGVKSRFPNAPQVDAGKGFRHCLSNGNFKSFSQHFDPIFN